MQLTDTIKSFLGPTTRYYSRDQSRDPHYNLLSSVFNIVYIYSWTVLVIRSYGIMRCSSFPAIAGFRK